MKIVVSGSTGLVGTALVAELRRQGHLVVRLVRSQSVRSSDEVFWDPLKGWLDPEKIEGADAVINLSGENLAARRWSERQKQLILSSRIDATRTLVKAFAGMRTPPKVFLNASAIGFYGDRGDEVCTEETSAGQGFLAHVCQQWEQAAMQACCGRVVLLRTGIVLSRKGGALAKMILPFRLGLGGILGTGAQYMSWISLDDLVALILYALNHEGIEGPLNAVAPHPVTNRVFTKALGKVLGKPTFFPVPAFVLRLLMGKEMADEMLLSSTRVVPKKLLEAHFTFRDPTIETALARC